MTSKRGQLQAERVAALRTRRQAGALAAESVQARHLAQAHARWEAGYLLPWRITMWLDSRGLYGPDVDAELGVAEPTVDQWEAGEVYPTWAQVLGLANLVGLPTPLWLTDAVGQGHDIGPIFVCFRGTPSKSSVIDTSDRVDRFSREALADHRARLAVDRRPASPGVQ